MIVSVDGSWLSKSLSRLGGNVQKLLGRNTFKGPADSIADSMKNIRTHSDVYLHAPELLQSATIMSDAIKHAKLEVGLDSETSLLLNLVERDLNVIMADLDKFRNSWEYSVVNIGYGTSSVLHSVVSMTLVQLDSWLKVAMFFGGFLFLFYIIESKFVKKGVVCFLACCMIAYSMSPAHSLSHPPSPVERNLTGPGLDEVSFPDPITQTEQRFVQPISLPLLDFLPNGAFFASSSHSSGTHEAHQSKMENTNCWHPYDHSNRHNQYVSVDLGAVHTINQIDVGSCLCCDQRVTKYEIHYKVELSDEWRVLSRHGANPDQQFVGPSYHKDIAINKNFKPFSARYVKFLPREYDHEPTFRWELHGFLGQFATTTIAPFDTSRAIGMN